jgi:hypothetical protein
MVGFTIEDYLREGGNQSPLMKEYIKQFGGSFHFIYGAGFVYVNRKEKQYIVPNSAEGFYDMVSKSIKDKVNYFEKQKEKKETISPDISY